MDEWVKQILADNCEDEDDVEIILKMLETIALTKNVQEQQSQLRNIVKEVCDESKL